MSSLEEKAILVRLNISQWNTRKRDLTATEQVQADFGCEQGTGLYWKNLSRNAFVKAVQSEINAMRTFHYERTLPWTDENLRILPSMMYTEYTAKIREFKSRIEGKVEDVANNWQSIKDEAKREQGKLYKEEDFPTLSEVKEKYGVNISVYPIPTKADFRIDLQSEDVEMVEKRLKDAMEMAMDSLWDRLYAVIAKCAEMLGTDKKFHDSLIGNIEEVIEILPKLNIADDKKLKRMARLIEEKICILDPSELRKEPEARKDAAEDAKKILDVMAGYMGI